MIPTTRMSEKAVERRRKILQTAVRIFAREGFANADVQVIADLSRTGKGTVYRYFGNKEELFLAAAQAAVEWMAEFVAQSVEGEGTVADQLRRIAHACAVYCQDHPEVIEIMIQERAQSRDAAFPTALLFRSDRSGGLDMLVRLGIEQGEFRAVEASAAASGFLDLIFGAIVCGCLGGGRRRLSQRVDQAVEIFLEGLKAR